MFTCRLGFKYKIKTCTFLLHRPRYANFSQYPDNDSVLSHTCKSHYLSVCVFITSVLIGDTVNKEKNIVNKQKLLKIQLEGGRPVSYLQSVQELNRGPPKTYPSSGREEDLNPGRSLAYKSSDLTTRPHSPPQRHPTTLIEITVNQRKVSATWTARYEHRLTMYLSHEGVKNSLTKLKCLLCLSGRTLFAIDLTCGSDKQTVNNITQ